MKKCKVCGAELAGKQQKYCTDCGDGGDGRVNMLRERGVDFSLLQDPLRISLGEGHKAETFYTDEAPICLNCPLPADECNGTCFQNISRRNMKSLAKGVV